MGPVVIHGVPAHALLVHVVVVLVPLTAFALLVCAVVPSWIRRLGIVLPGLALVTLISVPVTTHAGEWLKRRVPSSPLVEKHADLGGTLWPWVLAMFLVAAAVWWAGRRSPFASETAQPGNWRTGTAILRVPLHVVAVVLAIVVAAGSVIQLYRIGDAGAVSVWRGSFSDKPLG
ncbi:hypothetical protein OG413_42405 [Streptomyces sp. NBC_01433]|uniref:DUF2231 domain-containing protein n=1 Tax=Streptomyces sp. NBC_01433 TaxID=2903864 RepID=UPI00224F3C37|nr:DUF2231 domain-containing protein [Streptomyces sp. NBC_01433]MCX4681859.1 hypothetical protein [Streptomyces sp. NBC_01433]